MGPEGMVMRTLVERARASELVLVDGVKVIEDDGWALVCPTPRSRDPRLGRGGDEVSGPRPACACATRLDD